MKELIKNVQEWSKDRNLDNTDPKIQYVKLQEEAGELARGILKNDKKLIVDSLGDVMVVLIIMHQQLGLTLEETLGFAWNEIKDRTGKTVDGVFVKDVK